MEQIRLQPSSRLNNSQGASVKLTRQQELDRTDGTKMGARVAYQSLFY